MATLTRRPRPSSGLAGTTAVPQGQPAVKTADPADLGSLLLQLLGVSDLLCFHQDRDEEGNVVEVSVSLVRDGRQRVVVARERAEDAMSAAAAPRSKRCIGPCGLELSLEMFPRQAKESVDGRSGMCRFCQRARVALWKRAKKGLPPAADKSL